ncbi:MAG: HNH endonuclease [Anaerolineaceae bacterium]|nr:HNH endonuclease [Anaerolineaceae bacterium]
MKSYVGITDWDWFDLLRSQDNIEEVNFWQPSGKTQFRALQPGELFLFKLHSPNNFIVGGGFFAHSTLLPISLAWDSFGIYNGATNLSDMRKRVEKYRRQPSNKFEDYTIGCILLEQPFFLPKNSWIPVPYNWAPNLVQGRGYDLSVEPGKTIWDQLRICLQSQPTSTLIKEERPQYGNPVITYPRLGQGSFRVLITDTYERKCAITNERTLPALDAAHIKPYSENGLHEVTNGILLRKDLHALFDTGYITVTPEYRIEISKRIKEEYENGRDYYRHHGNLIRIPKDKTKQPDFSYLSWHNENIFRE